MVKLTYDDDMLYLIIENITYRLDVHAEADYCYTSGTMYRNNGDPGDPPDEELDIKRVVVRKRVNDSDLRTFKEWKAFYNTEKEKMRRLGNKRFCRAF